MSQTLVVPLNLAALRVGAQDKVQDLAGPTADFSRLPDQKYRGAYASRRIVHSLGQPSFSELLPGVHLHWQLPDALSRGVHAKDSGRIEFPPVPNRWLVTRLWSRAGETPRFRRWVVESDRLMTRDEFKDYYAAERRSATAVPVEPAPDVTFRYMGRAFDADGWSEKGGSFLAGLTALGFAGTAFASYYPDCQGVFGFYDRLDDADFPRGQDMTVSYHVVGWHSDAAQDPLRRAGAEAAREAWVFAEGASPSRSLYSGSLRSVPWNSATESFLAPGPDLSSLQAAVGNTTTEALAALLKETWRPPAANSLDPRIAGNVELLLDALQLGLLDRLDAVRALPQLEDALHQSSFGSVEGGTSWSAKRPEAKDLEGAAGATGAPLPEELARPLAELNALQRAADRTEDEIRSRREQLFLDWYRYIHVVYPPSGATDAAALDRNQRFLDKQLQGLGELEEKSLRQAADADRAAAALSAALKKAGCELRRSAAPRFWRPNDPVLLLSGEGIRPVRRNGSGERLPCRLDSELLTAPWAGGLGVPKAPGSLPDAAAVDRLLAEALLLDGQCAAASAALLGRPAAAEEVRLAQEAIAAAPARDPKSGPLAFTGLVCDGAGQRSWRDGWLPLLLHWKLLHRPVQGKSAREHGPDWLLSHFALERGGIDLLPRTASLPVGSVVYEGSAPLSDKSAFSLADQIEKHVAAGGEDPGGRLAAVARFVKGLPLLSQALSGLNESFMTRRQEMQLPPIDPFAKYGYTQQKDIRRRVGAAFSSAPVEGGGFSPLRGGFLSFDELQVIDVFGRRSRRAAPPLLRARGLLPPGESGAGSSVYLPPRLVQPSRLNFRWVDEGRGPILGWIVPNLWEESLAVYDSDGKALGSLGLEGRDRRVTWRRAPGPDGSPAGDPERDLAGASAAVRRFVTTARREGYVAEMLQAIESASLNILPDAGKARMLGALAGRPLALVRATLSLELRGDAAVDQSESMREEDIAAGGEGYAPARRATGGASEVLFPVRLGDVSQAEDGLIGYLMPGDDTFYSPAAKGERGVVAPAPDRVKVSVSGAPVELLLLIDPRVKLHAATGVLPVKEIDVPPESCAAALQAINVTFFAGPVLRSADGLKLPVPEQAGYGWKWTQTGRPDEPLIPDLVDDRAGLAHGPLRILDGWLKLGPKEGK